MGLRIKICGITNPEQARAIAELGATALGFICASQSPRYVTPQQIGDIVGGLPLDPTTGRISCDRIGVFVNADLATIQQTVAIGQLSGVQLHGDESPDFCAQLRDTLPPVELIKAFRVRSASTLAAIQTYETSVDTLLLDAYDPNLAGGTGHTIDWQALQEFRPRQPWFLAGGLTPANILTALRQLRPHGIDLSSGVEQSPGNKDLTKVAQLFDQLRQYRPRATSAL